MDRSNSIYAMYLYGEIRTLLEYQPGDPIWRYREDDALARMNGGERDIWHRARAAALADGLLFMAHPLHVAVGRKPEGGR